MINDWDPHNKQMDKRIDERTNTRQPIIIVFNTSGGLKHSAKKRQCHQAFCLNLIIISFQNEKKNNMRKIIIKDFKNVWPVS